MVALDESGLTLTPERCQEHAKACREMARAKNDGAERKFLEDIAAAWEDLCEELQGR